MFFADAALGTPRTRRADKWPEDDARRRKIRLTSRCCSESPPAVFA